MHKLLTVLTLMGAATVWSSAAPTPDDHKYYGDPGYNYPPIARSSSEVDKSYSKYAKSQRKLWKRDQKAAEKMMKKSSSDRAKYYRERGAYPAPYYPPR